MNTLALELTSEAVFDEQGLQEYAEKRLTELTRAELHELIVLLSAVAGATYEAWAEEKRVDVAELLAAAGMYNATHKDDDG